LLQQGTENKTNEIFEVGQGSHDLFDSALFEDEVLVVMEIYIIKFRDRQTMY
jgi:hypothetical protein